MLSYSTREIRRIGDQATVGAPGVHVSPKRPTPRGAGAAGPPPSSPSLTGGEEGEEEGDSPASLLGLDVQAGASAMSTPTATPPIGYRSELVGRIDE
jgi:hypothetical protein